MNALFSLNNFFICFNTVSYGAVAFWLIRTHIIPRIRASLINSQETYERLAEELIQQRNAVKQAQNTQEAHEREIARLTTALEKWGGVLSQRAAAAEKEARELSFRYKNRCFDNARTRVLEEANRLVIKNVLKKVRANLIQEYAHSEKQHQYTATVIAKMVHKETA